MAELALSVRCPIVARIHTEFPGKFGIPRQAGRVPELRGTVVFEKEYRDPAAIRGIEGFSHLWLLWVFSENLPAPGEKPSLTVRPPRLGGNTRLGVFATRSPFRPSPIGLSAVKLMGVEDRPGDGRVLIVSGADLMDGTPIVDIKPYLPGADLCPDAVGGFADAVADWALDVEFPPELEALIPPARREALRRVLADDPRPSYQDDPCRLYGFVFSGWEIEFTVSGRVLHVRRVVRPWEKSDRVTVPSWEELHGLGR